MFVFLYVYLHNAGETFGFVHIEAAAQGLPVIAFNMSANSESILDLGTSVHTHRRCDDTGVCCAK